LHLFTCPDTFKKAKMMKARRFFTMKTETLLDRITIHSEIMLGKPTIRGMRITVEQLLRALSQGISEQELLEEYPELEKADIQAVFVYVTGLVEEEQVFPVRGSA